MLSSPQSEICELAKRAMLSENNANPTARAINSHKFMQRAPSRAVGESVSVTTPLIISG